MQAYGCEGSDVADTPAGWDDEADPAPADEAANAAWARIIVLAVPLQHN
jgi:hypothetical protein